MMVDQCPNLISRTNFNPIWRALAKYWKDLQARIAWSVGNDISVRPLKDIGVPSLGSLSEHVGMLNSFSRITLLWISLIIVGNVIMVNSLGLLLMKCTYIHPGNVAWNPKDTFWKALWKIQVPQRLRVFLWVAYKNHLMTNLERCHRSIGSSPFYGFCSSVEESSIHILRDCIGSVGGLFRNNTSDWISGFQKSIGITSTIQAELWAILIGLQCAQKKGFEMVQIHFDCVEAVDIVNNPNASRNPLSLVRLIDAIRCGAWATEVVWTPQECNKPANYLVRTATPHSLELIYLFLPPAEVISLLEQDSVIVPLLQ
ncbi:hypothetical protein F3Y22_tig00110646pilonHSYRG00115 [Hibiscus syriacus]|uniref:RNase H type-1 domain-containing protein n=1 Tax=Hibiscus syriacus TaxID=106335 RepID=A0A6A2ZY70_HIBSY|nr:hypothetical protein F3Y22_tig00110646pilonHSYRG00115 [Hibiscus syriacus]